MKTHRQYDDPFEELLAEIVREIAEEMNKLQPQDLTFHDNVVYLDHAKRLEKARRDDHE
jgi:hypothetical protein